nr:reverse transcriptase domain-containing protein [Tanacetum cinerariifolium]
VYKLGTLDMLLLAFLRLCAWIETKKADARSKIASTSFAHLSKQVLVEELKEKSMSEVEILAVVEEEGDTWMTPLFKYLAEGTLPEDVKKERAIRRKSWRFADDPFKDWCEKLCIRQHFASVKHPQTNGLVERANRSLGEGIKARLDARRKNWIEELPHVLWAHRTMIKSSNEDTPFSLTYGTEAVIQAEIGMPTLKTTEILADFIVERPKENSPDTPMEEEGELLEPWILFTDGSSCTDGSRAGPILTNPEEMEFTYALRFRFDATNNEAEYEALIAGLRIVEQMGVKTYKQMWIHV